MSAGARPLAPAELRFVVARSEDGTRLDSALAAKPEVGSRARAQRLIARGRVSVDGGAATKSRRLARGEHVIALLFDPADEPPPASPRERSVPVAFEDAYLIVVDKPAGLVVHPAAGHPIGTLVQELGGRSAGGSDPWRPGIVHRLDRDTSGLMVVAKSDAVHAALQRLIRARELDREYLALVEGRPDARSGTIDAPIGRDRRQRTVHSTRTDRPRSARTHFQIERSYPATTLLRVRLETGRTHQIRVHLAAIGHPICGDQQYGGGSCGNRLGLRRQFLHSARLAFMHPLTRERVACESELPEDLRHATDAAASD